MNKDRTNHTDSSHRRPAVSLVADPDINEALRQAPVGLIGPRRLIAAGIKRGTGQLVVKAVA